MSLNIVSLLPQIHSLVEMTISRNNQADKSLPKLLHTLETFEDVDQELLLHKVDTVGQGWPAAIPTHEQAQNTYPPPEPRNHFGVIATDGSQIHPDRHSSSFYYLINIGMFLLQHGSGAPPRASSRAKLFFEEDNLYDEFGSVIQASSINAKRDVLELESLANLSGEVDEGPTVALLDNGLLLWLAAQGGQPRSRVVEALLQEYLEQLTRIQRANVSLAGFIDRPRHWNTVAMLALTSIPLDELGALKMKANPLRNISDGRLFRQILKPGHRSSLFLQRSTLNAEFKAAGQEICYFYLHTGAGDNIVRVEVPEWVAKSKFHMDTLHDSLLQQCKQTAGYPYALIRAHELAVVSHADRQNLEARIQRRQLERGIRLSHSQKAETKRWTRAKRRHHL